MPKIQEDLLEKSFPHSTYYPGQKEAYREVVQAFLDGKRYVLLEMPVGGGKSAIALGVSNYFADSTLICTHTKVLQEQYSQESHKIKVVKGASNYYCKHEKTTCDVSATLNGGYCSAKCPYDKLIKQLKSPSGIFVVNNDLAWAHFFQSPHSFPTVVFDEVHLLDSKLQDLLSLTLSESFFKTYKLAPVEKESDILSFCADWITVFKSLEPELKAQLNSQRGSIRVQAAQSLNNLNRINTTCRIISSNFNETPWVIDEVIQKDGTKSITIKPTFGGFLAKVVMGCAKRILCMSATINYNQFCVDHRIPKEKTQYIEKMSYFPVGNRPLIYMPRGKMSRDEKFTTLPNQLQTIDKILSMLNPDIKGIIHVSQFGDANYIKSNSKHSDRMITHISGEHEKCLRKHESKPGSIIVTPSMWEGVDLKNDMARLNIITKVPYPYAGDRQIQSRMALKPPIYNGRAWYYWVAAAKMAQAYGRTTRSPDDWSLTIIMDTCFSDFIRYASPMLPQYFKESLQNFNNWSPSDVFKNGFFLEKSKQDI